MFDKPILEVLPVQSILALVIGLVQVAFPLPAWSDSSAVEAWLKALCPAVANFVASLVSAASGLKQIADEALQASLAGGPASGDWIGRRLRGMSIANDDASIHAISEAVQFSVVAAHARPDGCGEIDRAELITRAIMVAGEIAVETGKITAIDWKAIMEVLLKVLPLILPFFVSPAPVTPYAPSVPV